MGCDMRTTESCMNDKRMAMRIFYFPTFLMALKAINDNPSLNSLKLSSKCKVSYSHFVNIREHLLERGLIIIKNMDGRSKNLAVTDKGKRIVEYFNSIIKELDTGDSQSCRLGGKEETYG